MTDALETLDAILGRAENFSAVFGPTPTESALSKAFKQLAKNIHPDKVPDADRTEAHRVFTDLQAFYKAAQAALKAGVYETAHPKSLAGPVVLQSALATYRLELTPVRRGDFSILYRAVSGADPVLVKVAKAPSLNARLEREAILLGRFNGKAASKKTFAVGEYIPHCLDTFLCNGDNGQRFRVNAMSRVSGFCSLSDVVATNPAGLDPRDAAWIFRRVLAQAIAASMVGVVHTAIVPDHVLINPATHEPLHIGWAHAIDVDGPGRVTQIISRWSDCYPPEILRKEKPTQATDLYMAAKVWEKLLGKRMADVPNSIRAAVAPCLLREKDKRPQARAVLDDFTRVIRAEWGREFRPMTLPVGVEV